VFVIAADRVSPKAACHCAGSSRATEMARSNGVNAKSAAIKLSTAIIRFLRERRQLKKKINNEIKANTCPHSVAKIANFQSKLVGAGKTANNDKAKHDAPATKRSQKNSKRCDVFDLGENIVLFADEPQPNM
jgi:hypothetical protein